jgi:malate dehydrogenase (quinone)
MEMVADVVLVGAGVMSATLAALLRELDPGLSIRVFERLNRSGAESSDAWNNAGTGHSGFCELNYTPELADGSVDVHKALRIAEQFELSRQFWGSLVEAGKLPEPSSFIQEIPHVSFVWGERDVAFLGKRHAALSRSVLFEGMEFTEDPARIAEVIPLVMEGRKGASVAATFMAQGTDVNFGALTRALLEGVCRSGQVQLELGSEVRAFERGKDGLWHLDVMDLESGFRRIEPARFVFIGAGGASMPLLEMTGIDEARGYGAFPVSGQWLRCARSELIARHAAKVYGQAEVGAPPMSVPHLDTRWVDGNRELFFGPYAGFTTKFLKSGSYLDLFRSLELENLTPMLSAGARNLDLTTYLVGQALLDHDARMSLLRRYFPNAQASDWEHLIAGQRVQVIKRAPDGRGILQFGTEVVTSKDGSMSALLGASPGASTAVAIMLDLLSRCMPERMATEAWQSRLRALIPSYGRPLGDHPALCRQMRTRSAAQLGLGS